MKELKKKCVCDGDDADCVSCYGAGYIFNLYWIKELLDAQTSTTEEDTGKHYAEISLEHLVLDEGSPLYVRGLVEQLKEINSVMITFAKDDDTEIDILVRRYEGFSE